MKKFLLSALAVLSAGVSVMATPASQCALVNSGRAATRQHAPAKAGEAAYPDVISEEPQGTKVLYARSGEVFERQNEAKSRHYECSKYTEVIWGNDGRAYVKSALMSWDNPVYLIGDFVGNDVVFKFPQTYNHIEWKGYHFYSFVNVLKCTDSTPGNEVYVPVSEADGVANEVRFAVQGNSMVMRDISDDKVVVGAVDENGTWNYSADWGVRFDYFEDTPVAAPEGVEVSEWFMSYGIEARNVKVAVKDNEMYLGNISKYFPEAWIKGTIADGKVTFKSGQYLGVDHGISNHFCYFVGATVKDETDGTDTWEMYYPTENLVFDYNAAAKTMSTDSCMMINTNAGEYAWYLEAFKAPMVRASVGETSNVPKAPVINTFTPYDEIWLAGNVQFDIPTLSETDSPLDTDKLYYRFYVEDMPFTFYPDDYKSLSVETTDIPFSYKDDYDFFANGAEHRLYFRIMDVAKIGLQSVYKLDGEEYVSPITVAEAPAAALDKVDSEKTVAAEAWYDLTGRRVANPAAGLYIRHTIFTDGSAAIAKIVK